MASITFLGTGGSVVTKERMCSGVLFGNRLIDVGFGVVTNLVRSGTKLDSIDDVYISHTHSDHIGDFTGLIWAMAMENRTKPVRVVSSSETATVLRQVLALQATPKEWVKFRINFVSPENVGLKYMKTLHEPENLAYRFKVDGIDLVYVGDTTRCEPVAEFAKECDLMIHDATFLNGQESIAAVTNHSTAKDAASIAKLAKTRKLALTHISPANGNLDKKYLAEASSAFDGEIVLARDHKTITI